jgi:putative ABC transport system permease protein
MPRIPGLRRIFQLPRRASDLKREIDAEVTFHFDQRIADLVARGFSADAARAEAERAFGDVTRVREELTRIDRSQVAREQRLDWLMELRENARDTVRMVRRQPAFATALVVTLALGIGANAAMLGVADMLLLRPPPHVIDADQLARIYLSQPAPGESRSYGSIVTYVHFRTWRDHVPALEHVATYKSLSLAVGVGAAAQQVSGVVASGNFFELLGAHPALGRFFTEADDRPHSASNVVVLGDGFWKRQYGSDPAAIGRTLLIQGEQYSIVGIAPEGFRGVELDAVDLFMPLSAYMEGKPFWDTDPSPWWLYVIGRLRPGANVQQASAQATGAYLASSLVSSASDSLTRVYVGPLSEMRGPSAPRTARIAIWMFGLSSIVLLIAAANVANLLLLRGMQRRRETAVRLALGAGRGRLVRQVLTESVILSAFAGVLGMFVAWWGARAVGAMLVDGAAWTSAVASPRLLLTVGAATLALGTVIGVAPALFAVRLNLPRALKSTVRDGGSRRSAVRTSLLFAQVALSVILLSGALLFTHSLWRAVHTDVGFDAKHVLFVHSPLRTSERSAAEIEDFNRRAALRAGQLPGVIAAAVARDAPMISIQGGAFSIPGVDSAAAQPAVQRWTFRVAPEFFQTLGMRVIRGRRFTADEARSGNVVMINETMARAFWPGRNPLGECIRLQSTRASCSFVVGVVGDHLDVRIDEPASFMMYTPLKPDGMKAGTQGILVRVSGDAHAMISPIRQAVAALGSDLPFVSIDPLGDGIDYQLRPWRLGATVFGLFGALALLLAAVGLYSVLSFSVAQRTFEIGIRTALGATRRDVTRLIVGEGLRVVLFAIAIGTAAVFLAAPKFGSLLYETSPRDPLTYVGVVALLIVAALLACLLPALRATRVAPSIALRAE